MVETSVDRALRIAVVGHTNTGKTSLLRTLTRDRGFGEVSFRPGTTRHVEVASLLVEGRVLLELYDTPGLEDPIALWSRLDQIKQDSDQRLDGPERIARFLESPSAEGEFEQEAKVLRQMLSSDAAFYVVDARDPVLSKHRDELSLLADCGIPLLPLLNFVAEPGAREDEWREMFSRSGLHAVVRFDTVAPERGSERLLYEKMGSLLDPWRAHLQTLIQRHEAEAQQRRRAALRLIAELLIDVAAYRLNLPAGAGSESLRHAAQYLNEQVRGRERRCLMQMLDLYRFSEEDVAHNGIAIREGQWEHDLFDPETLQLMGVRIGSGAAAGAATGLGVDLMVGGLTLGAAAGIGALAGGGLQTLRHYGGRIRDRLRGEQQLRVQDEILLALALRQSQLLQGVEGRGHAAQSPLQASAAKSDLEFWPKGLPGPLRRARSRPEWSLMQTGALENTARSAAVTELTDALGQRYEESLQ